MIVSDVDLENRYPPNLRDLVFVNYDFKTNGAWYRDSSASPDKELVLLFCDDEIEMYVTFDEKPYNYFDDDYIKTPLAPGESYSCPVGEGTSWGLPGFTFGEAKELQKLSNKFVGDTDCDIENRFNICKTHEDRQYRQEVRNRAKLKAFNTILASKALKQVINAG